MREKVTITREQAEAIETELKDESKVDIVEYHIKHNYTSDVPIAKENMSTDKLIQALYIGYEVEPEFKSGQWVALDDYAIRPIIAKILEIDVEGDGRIRLDWSDHCYWDKERIRAATPSEIAAEKERRWWNKHGRDVWELRTGDVISDEEGDFREVSSDRNPGDDGVALMDGGFNQKYLETFCKVVCFKENRMDVSE